MKLFLFLIGIILLHGTCSGQETTTAATDEGSGADLTPTPTTDPCDDTECQTNAECKKSEDGVATCECKEDYQEVEGGTCFLGCSESDAEFDNTNVRFDLENCASISEASNETYTATFAGTIVGSQSTANYSCKTTCDGTGIRSVGVRTCEMDGGEAKWSEPIFTDCSTKLADQSLETKTDNALIYTSDPAAVTDEQVNAAVEVVEQTASKDSISSQEVVNVMTITSNLLEAESTSPENVSSLITSVDEIAEAAKLDSVDGADYSELVNVQSRLSLAVVGDNPLSRVYADETYYFGTTGNLPENLLTSELEITTSKPAGVYISAKPEGTERLYFKVYTESDSIFPALDEVVSNKIVLSAGRAGLEDGSFTFNFELNEKISLIGDDGRFNETTTDYKRLQCVRYDLDTTKWDVLDESCFANSGDDGFATCTCTKPGEYTIRKITIQNEGGDGGLSPGAIAGIVIGSVLGVALIGGGLFYFCFYSKKKTKRAVSPDNHEMRGYDNASSDGGD